MGRGTIDFAAALAALADAGYRGVYSLELETRDVANDDRARVAHESADLITAAHPEKGTA